MFRLLRRGFLLFVLVLVAGGSWLASERATSWERTLWVTVHPINGDGSAASERYIEALEWNAFEPIDAFLAEQSQHHGISLGQPVHVVLGAPVTEQPPPPPREASALGVMLWSLRLRYWAWRVDRGEDPTSTPITIFVRYFDPKSNPRLEHSLGLQKGHLGVVNAFANPEYAGSNRVLIAHELLHTLGATDKYDPANGQPLFPDGYAEPYVDPRLPQRFAELMGGRIPITATRSEIPESLADVRIGPSTALEIGWSR